MATALRHVPVPRLPGPRAPTVCWDHTTLGGDTFERYIPFSGPCACPSSHSPVWVLDPPARPQAAAHSDSL